MAQSKAHMKASNKYSAKAYDRLAISVYKGQRDQITEYAKSKGLSINGYINALIAADMGEKLTRPEKTE